MPAEIDSALETAYSANWNSRERQAVVITGKQTPQMILCVDDDQEIRELLQELITQLGHKSDTAVDGIDALEKLKNGHFDIVITDLSMPRLDGMELIKRIAADFKDVDVIAITGYRMKYKYTDVIEVGASDFLSKPFRLDELQAKINRIVRERSLRAELRKLSIRDALTGLYNRRYFDENLRHEAMRALRQQYGLYLLLMDIDNFKEYNDRHGHLQGDVVLKELARIILQSIRKEVDSAYRYGGDEFALVVPHANRQQAQSVAERLRRRFEARKLAPATLSIGMAALTGSPETLAGDLKNLVSKADQALYVAKNSGGNRVCDESGS